MPSAVTAVYKALILVNKRAKPMVLEVEYVVPPVVLIQVLVVHVNSSLLHRNR